MNVVDSVTYLFSKASRPALGLCPASYCTRKVDSSLRGKRIKVKFKLELAMKAQKGNRGIAVLFL